MGSAPSSPLNLCPNLRFCTGGKNALGHILRPAALAAERRAERFGDGADVLRFGRQGKIPAVFARNEHQRQLCAFGQLSRRLDMA